MKCVLTHQSAHVNGHDVLVIDSVLSEYKGTPEQVEAMKIINDQEGKRNYFVLKKLAEGFTPSLSIRVGKESGNVYVDSHFLSIDDKGRRIPFSFWMESKEPKAVVEKLKTASKIANMQINPSDLNAIEKSLKFYPVIRITAFAGIILLAIILTIIIV